jgi:DNA-binding response OmpR family regulator
LKHRDHYYLCVNRIRGNRKTCHEHFDCVILDLSLPDISGFEILSRIKNNESPFLSPIIVYTGKRLSSRERAILDEYTESIVIRG